MVAAGCGSSDSERSAATSTAAVPAAFSLRNVPQEGFSIAFPKNWQSLDAREALDSDEVRRFRQANPALRAQIDTLTAQRSPIKLIAVAPDPRGGFLTNFNVLVTDVPSDASFEDWSSASLEQIEHAPTVKDLKQEETTLPAGESLHLAYHASFNRGSEPIVAYVHQYLVKDGASLYVLTYVTQRGLEPRLRKTFAASARTFRLTG